MLQVGACLFASIGCASAVFAVDPNPLQSAYWRFEEGTEFQRDNSAKLGRYTSTRLMTIKCGPSWMVPSMRPRLIRAMSLLSRSRADCLTRWR